MNAAELLAQSGANVHAINSYGCNATQWAAQVKGGGTAPCEWLRSRGVTLGLNNYNGHSAIHKAAVKGNEEVCRWLLCEGGLLAERHMGADGDGNTPASMAASEGHESLALKLDGVQRGTPPKIAFGAY